MKYLFLDDLRHPSDVTWVPIARTNQWAIVRSYSDAVQWVLDNGFPDVVSFDHDLGYEEFELSATGILVVTDATEAESGYDFAKWLIEYDMDTNLMPDTFSFTVHSMNPVGTRNIEMLLDNYTMRVKGIR